MIRIVAILICASCAHPVWRDATPHCACGCTCFIPEAERMNIVEHEGCFWVDKDRRTKFGDCPE